MTSRHREIDIAKPVCPRGDNVCYKYSPGENRNSDSRRDVPLTPVNTLCNDVETFVACVAIQELGQRYRDSADAAADIEHSLVRSQPATKLKVAYERRSDFLEILQAAAHKY